MFCIQCGNSVEIGDMFCKVCGQKTGTTQNIAGSLPKPAPYVATNIYQSYAHGHYAPGSFIELLHSFWGSRLFLIGAVLSSIGLLGAVIIAFIPPDIPAHVIAANEAAMRELIGPMLAGLLSMVSHPVFALLLLGMPLTGMWMAYAAAKNPKLPEKTLASLTLYRIDAIVQFSFAFFISFVNIVAIYRFREILAFIGETDVIMIVFCVSALLILFNAFLVETYLSILKDLRYNIESNQFRPLSSFGRYVILSCIGIGYNVIFSFVSLAAQYSEGLAGSVWLQFTPMAARTGAPLGSSEFLTIFTLVSAAGSILSLILLYRLNNIIVMRPAYAPSPAVPSGQPPVVVVVNPQSRPITPPPAPIAKVAPPPQPPKAHSSQARMPLIFLLDTSSSASPYIKQLNDSLNRFKSEVCQDAQAKDFLDVAVMQFSETPALLQDFAPIGDMRAARLIAGGNTQYTAPIREALRMLTNYINTKPNPYKPWIILIAGSEPSDDIFSVAMEIKNMQGADRLRFMALGVQGCDTAVLKRLTDVVFRLDGTDFASFFAWIGKCTGAISRSKPGEKPQLPPLMGNVYREK